MQAARKDAGLNVEDRIALTLGGDDGLLDAVRAHEPYVTGETLAVSLSFDGGDPIEIEGRELPRSALPALRSRSNASCGRMPAWRRHSRSISSAGSASTRSGPKTRAGSAPKASTIATYV